MSELISPSLETPQGRSPQPGRAWASTTRSTTACCASASSSWARSVEDANANAICAQLLLLAADDPDKDIWLYINSPGGSVSAGMAIYDTMQWVKNDVATVAMGLAASMGQFLLCAGAPGKRYALPHARIMMHQPSGGLGGTASDIRIQAEQMLYTKRKMAELHRAAHRPDRSRQIEADSDRDRWFTAEEAKDYGFVDQVVASAGQVAGSGGTA